MKQLNHKIKVFYVHTLINCSQIKLNKYNTLIIKPKTTNYFRFYDRKCTTPKEFIYYATLIDKIQYRTPTKFKSPLQVPKLPFLPWVTQEQLDLCPPPSDLALGRFVRRVLVNGHLVEFVHLVGSIERGFELRTRGIGAHQPHLQKECADKG